MKKLAGAALLSLGDILGKLVGFLILPYLVSRMGAEEYGVLTLYLSFIQIFVIIISFSGQGLLPVKCIQESENSGLLFRRDNINLSWAVSAIIFGVFVAARPIINIELSVADIFWIVFASLAQAINLINLSHLRISQTYRVATIGQFSLSIINVVGTILLFHFISGTAVNRLVAVSFSFLSVQIFYTMFIYSNLYFKSSYVSPINKVSRYKEIVQYGVSLWPHHLSYWIKSSIDRFFIAHYMSIAVVGVYGLAMQLSSIPLIFFTVVSQACQPFIYRYLNERNMRMVKKIQFGYVLMVLVSGIFCYIIMPYIFPMFFSHKFEKSIVYFNYLLPGTLAMCMYYIFTHALFFYKKNKIISFITAASMIVHLIGVFLVVNSSVSVERFCIIYSISSGVAFLATAFFCNKQIYKIMRS